MANQTCAERKQIAKNYEEGTVWKVSIFGFFLVRIFPHSPNAGKYDQKSSEYGDFSRSRIVWKIFSCVLRLWCCSKFWIQPYFDSNQKKPENFLMSERLRSYQKVKMMKFEGGWDKLWGKKCFYRQRSTYKIVSLLPKSYFWREDWQLGCTAPSFDTFKNIFLIS